MTTRSFRPLGTAVLVALAVLAVGASISISGPAVGPQNPDNNDAIKKLLNERRAVLMQLVEVQVDGYRTGKVELQSISEAQRQLLDVELELTADHGKQVELLKASISMARDMEKLAEKRYQTGTVTNADVLRAKATRLDLETVLLRARQK